VRTLTEWHFVRPVFEAAVPFVARILRAEARVSDEAPMLLN
jgi:hypothetical protein